MSDFSPKLLTEVSYEAVSDYMLGYTDPKLPSAAAIMPDAIGASNRAMPNNMMFDRTFVRQMNSLYRSTDGLEGLLPPSAIVVTANSAVPVADAVRGFYEEVGETTPLIIYIKADSFNGLELHTVEEINQRAAIKASQLGRPFKKEVRRLTPILEGVDHVCLIDQYVSSGDTLRYASLVLKQAGVKIVSAIRGNWYEGAMKKDIDLQSVSSIHSRFMYRVGALSCQKAFESAG